MGKLLVNDKEVVVPGEVIAEGLDFLPAEGAFREGDNIIASKLGLVNVSGRLIKLIPLAGKYLPKRGDVIIGKVTDITINGWKVDLNSAYPAMLSMKEASSRYIARGADLTTFFNFGDYIETKIINVTSQNLVDLTMRGPGLKKLGEGRIVKINPNKVPRVIGKAGSMVSLIKNLTKCNIIVGQNGVVWISGDPKDELLAVKAIRMIEEEAHIPGLTERVQKLLEQKEQKRV